MGWTAARTLPPIWSAAWYGAAALYDRLGAPEVRAAIPAELSASGRWSRVSDAENVLILRVAAEENRKWQGRTLAEVAAVRGADPVETAMDLIASDRSRIQATCGRRRCCRWRTRCGG
jgi:N-acyl-D-aspartate/D-glutamate deacylase